MEGLGLELGLRGELGSGLELRLGGLHSEEGVHWLALRDRSRLLLEQARLLRRGLCPQPEVKIRKSRVLIIKPCRRGLTSLSIHRAQIQILLRWGIRLCLGLMGHLRHLLLGCRKRVQNSVAHRGSLNWVFLSWGRVQIEKRRSSMSGCFRTLKLHKSIVFFIRS